MMLADNTFHPLASRTDAGDTADGDGTVSPGVVTVRAMGAPSPPPRDPALARWFGRGER